MSFYSREIIASRANLTGFFEAKKDQLNKALAQGKLRELSPDDIGKMLEQLEEAVRNPNRVRIDGLMCYGVPCIVKGNAMYDACVFTITSSEKVTAEQVDDCTLDLVEDLFTYGCYTSIPAATKE